MMASSSDGPEILAVGDIWGDGSGKILAAVVSEWPGNHVGYDGQKLLSVLYQEDGSYWLRAEPEIVSKDHPYLRVRLRQDPAALERAMTEVFG